MAIPVLKLNLAPEPSLWRQNHEALGWGAVGLGTLLLLGTSAFTGWKYYKATKEATQSFKITQEAQKVAREQGELVSTLRTVDVSSELPRWKLAERILSERTLPWSRLTAELERSLVQDVRVKSIQRIRGTDQTVQLALKGEARSRDAEVKFIERLQGNGVFAQVLLEREAERQGGGLDFEIKLPATATPKPYEPLPEPEFSRSAAPAPPVRGTPAPAARPGAPAKTPLARNPAPAGEAPKLNLPPPPDLSPGALSPEDRAAAIRKRIEQVRAAQQEQTEAKLQRDAEARRAAGQPTGPGGRAPRGAQDRRKEQP